MGGRLYEYRQNRMAKDGVPFLLVMISSTLDTIAGRRKNHGWACVS